MLQKSLLILLFTIVAFAKDITSSTQLLQVRVGNDTISHGSQISNTPYGYRIDSISSDMIKIISYLNMSDYADKRLFAGYGIYDKNHEMCKYLDSGVNMDEFNQKFHFIKTYNGHTYAVSRDPMSYNSCLAITATYNGNVFNPNSAAENASVIGLKTDVFDEDIWIGVHRKNCLEGYLNDSGNNQNYTNFADRVDNCEEDKLYAYKRPNTSLWTKENSGALHKCMIEIASLDVKRPIEVCAPWWRIERTFKVDTPNEVTINGVGIDVYGINQATLPMRMTTCVKYDNDTTSKQMASLANRDVICKTYYDMTMGEQCIRDIFQSSCFVDSCKGYITNVCSKNPIQPKQEEGMKDYEWGYIQLNGVMKKAKVKQGIQSFAYTCPPSGESLKKCQAMGDVIVFPYQCDSAVCDNYKKCIGAKESRTSCYKKYPCQEVYGEANDPVVENGKLVGFRGKCGEKSIINKNINTISQVTEKCLKYATITDFVSEKKKCTNVAKEKIYEVNATITQEDAYANKPNCIRLNNTDIARPKMKMIFNYENNGFFNLALTKSYIDGENNTNTSVAGNSLAHDLQYMILKKASSKPQTDIQAPANRCNTLSSAEWDNKRIGAFVDVANTNATDSKAKFTGLYGFLYDKKAPTAITKCLSNEIANGTTNCLLDADKNGVADTNQTSCPNTLRYTLETTGSKRCIAPQLVSYDRIAIVDKNIDATAMKDRIGFDVVNIGGMIDLSRYDITYLKDANHKDITTDDILSGKYIVIGGNKTVPGDNIIKMIRYFNNADVGNSTIELSSGNTAIKGEDCQDFANCKSYVMTSVYANPRQTQQCRITSNNEVGSSPLNNSNIPDADPNSVVYPQFVTQKDTITTELDGYNDIFSVQEYADGKFGYASNYHFLLPKNNTVSIDDKEIFPIVPQHALDMKLTYDYYMRQFLQNTKNKKPIIQQGSYEGAIIGKFDNSVILVASLGVGLAVAITLFQSYGIIFGASGIGAIVFVIIMLFGPNIKWGDMKSEWSVYKTISKKYAPNVYGYDLRLIDEAKGTETYTYEKLATPTAKSSDFEKMFRKHLYAKKSAFYWMGYGKGVVDDIILRPYEKTVQGYPGKCKWYKPSCRKTAEYKEGPASTTVIKQVNNVYIGAVNTVSVFVPYLGDYVLDAYSKGGTKIGEVLITQNDFIDGGASKLSYANVAFGINKFFQIAEGIEDGNTTKACRRDLTAEWGGGVSGVYYENLTPEGNDCSKSNDKYVQRNYADYITIRPVNSNKAFKIKMIKPMPYANRFFLVTYGKLENRKYRCYEMGAPCIPN